MNIKFNEEKRKLRRTAEEIARWAIVHPMIEETDTKKLLHELQVHVIELEMQNAELNHTQLEAEKTFKRLTAINENLQQSILDSNAKHDLETTIKEASLNTLLSKISFDISQQLNEISEMSRKIKQNGTDTDLLINVSKLEKTAQQLLQSVRSV